MNQDCLLKVRELYKLYSGLEIADCIKLVRAEMTVEEDRHILQQEILDKQRKLEELDK